jgi:hypothetical protein
MKRIVLIIGVCFMVSCSKSGSPSGPQALPDTVNQLCNSAGFTYTAVVYACGISVWTTEHGILIAGAGFNTPDFDGMVSQASGQCVLVYNAEARRDNVGDADFCDIIVAKGVLNASEDNSGYTQYAK